MSEKKKIFVSFTMAASVVILAYLYQLGADKNQELLKADLSSQIPESQEPPVLGEAGSTHEHASFLMFINGELFDFNQPQYMLSDALIHFENDNGIFIHKHATGTTLPYFLKTLGMELTRDCLRLDGGREFCKEGRKVLTFLVNGRRITNAENYEIRHKDKILLNYGEEDEWEIKFRANNIPDLPPSF